MNLSRCLAGLGIALAALSCVSVDRAPTVNPDAGWLQWSTPEDAGFDSAELSNAREQADKARSGAVMIVYRGRALTAWGDVSRELELHSVRKSLYAAMYGVAVDRGLMDIDSTLAASGVDDIEALTAEEKQARVEHLLYSRSGVYHPAAYAASDQDASRPARGSYAPGTHWYYNNWDFNVAGALLERAAGKPLGVLFEEWIARPIGMQDFGAEHVYAVMEPRNSQWPALTFRMSTRDLARFGTLWLNNGNWDGRQIVPVEWIIRASNPRTELSTPGQGYAMMWWTYGRGSLPAARYPNASRYAILQARGTGGQAVMLVPELDLVFVHRGDTDHGRRVSGGDVWTIFERVLSARVSEPRADARFVPMQPVPLDSQAPRFEWPDVVELSPGARDAVLGRYRFSQEIIATVFLWDERLFVTMPGQGEAELFPISPTEFFIRVDPTVAVRFEGDHITLQIKGREMKGERVL